MPELYSQIMDCKHPITHDLIIVHGLFGMSDNWAGLGRQFSEFCRVHLVDLRNHGRSFHSADMSIDLMSDDLINYLQTHGMDSAHFLGHSMGGKVVMHLALTQPEKVNGLMVADMAPKTYSAHHHQVFAALHAIPFDQIEKRSDIEPFITPYLDAATTQFILKNIQRTPHGYGFKFNLPAIEAFYPNLLHWDFNQYSEAFMNPTLFLRGEHSNYISANNAAIIMQWFKQAQIKTIDEAGHWLHAEQPQAFYDAVSTFLKAIP